MFLSNREIRKEMKRQTRDDIGEVMRVVGSWMVIEGSKFVHQHHKC